MLPEQAALAAAALPKATSRDFPVSQWKWREMMLIAEWVASAQVGGTAPEPSSPAAEYFVLGLIAVVIGLVVLVFIRSSARRSSKG